MPIPCHLLVEDGPEETAAAVVRLLRDEDRWRRIQTAARGLVENCFSLERAGPRVRARYRQFLEQAAGLTPKGDSLNIR